jgi:hypothetical protein
MFGAPPVTNPDAFNIMKRPEFDDCSDYWVTGSGAGVVRRCVGWQFFGRARVVDDPDVRAAPP